MTGQQRGLLPTLARLNRTAVFLGALAVTALGLFLPATVGALLLYAVVAVLAVLLRLTWPVTPPAMRAFRVLMLAILAAVATAKLLT
jgi:hypothetical protein